ENFEAAFTHLQQALDVYTTMADRKMIAKTSIEQAHVFGWAGRLDEAAVAARSGLAWLGDEITGERARLLAVLGQACGTDGNYTPADQALREAANVCAELADPALAASLAGARSTVDYQFFRLREAATEGLVANQSDTSLWERCRQLQTLYQTLIILGRMQ